MFEDWDDPASFAGFVSEGPVQGCERQVKVPIHGVVVGPGLVVVSDLAEFSVRVSRIESFVVNGGQSFAPLDGIGEVQKPVEGFRNVRVISAEWGHFPGHCALVRQSLEGLCDAVARASGRG